MQQNIYNCLQIKSPKNQPNQANPPKNNQTKQSQQKINQTKLNYHKNQKYHLPPDVNEPNIWSKDENEIGESEHNSSGHHCTTSAKPVEIKLFLSTDF